MLPRTFPINSELLVSIFVVAIALLLLVPLPTPLLDVLLVINLAVSFFLLLVVLYLPDSLKLLAFPTILLLTTLFRLGLNVASTRLILSEGDAGQVIEAFGTFLVGGELLVGIVIFAIITVINLVVIARGAGRISEVAARFALDSLPGKQMSIDADLRAGLISPQEAERRRDKLRRESQLYGSMDGAMKFVQGDALAGIVIIFTNVIGGLTIGLTHGMPLFDAITTYTVLTIGDGLVSQIPAFLIAICAGLVVTRISSAEQTTLGTDLRDQLFGQPTVLVVVAALLAGIALIQGMPTVPFLAIAFATMVIWFLLIRQGSSRLNSLAPNMSLASIGLTDARSQSEINSQHGTKLLSYSSSLTLALDPQSLFPAFLKYENDLYERWNSLASESIFYFGASLPIPKIEADPSLSKGRYELRKNEQILCQYEIPAGAVYLPIQPNHCKLIGVEVLREENDPILGGLGSWVLTADGALLAEVLRVPVFTWLEFIGLQLFEYCRRNPNEVMTMSHLLARLKELENIQPGLVSQSFENYGMDVSRLTNVVHQLTREGLPFLGLHKLIEDIATYYGTMLGKHEGEKDFDISDLVAFIRLQNRTRLLGAQRGSTTGSFRILRLSKETENLFFQSEARLLGGGSSFGRDNFNRLKASLEPLLHTIREKGVLPISVECPEILRVPVFQFLQALPYFVHLMCDEEMEVHIPRTVVGIWGINSE